MAEKKIDHTLRTIVLCYDDTKAETGSEKELLRAYLALHNHALRFNTGNARLNYEYKELEDSIAQTEKKFAPLARQILAIYNKAQQIKTDSDFDELEDEMNAFYPAIDSIQNELLQPLYDEYKRLYTENTAHEEDEETLGEELEQVEAQALNLFQSGEDYSLDPVAWDDDIENFKDVFSKSDKFSKESYRIEKRYEQLLETIQTAWTNWENTQLSMSSHHDTGNLLDTSISDSYAAGTGNPDLKPIYIIEPGDKLINQFRKQYGSLARPDRHTLNISVPVDVIRSGDVMMLQQIFMQMQHFPKLIEKWTFAVRVEITDFDTRPLDEDEWKGVPAAMHWFRKLNYLPFAIFFLEDRDARGYAIIGDLLADNKLPIVGVNKQGDEGVELSGEILEEICKRLLTACCVFMLFCHNTGYNPKYPIEALLAEFDLPVTYELVQQQYEEELRNGAKFVTVKSNE